MTWELICLKPNPQREGDDEVYVFVQKSARRSTKQGINAIQYSVKLSPLPLQSNNGERKALVHMEDAVFHVVADLDAQALLFDIGKADSALPSLLRGGGAGSLVISELIIWAQKNYPQLPVALNKISPALLNYPNAKAISTKCLQNFGFSVGKASGGGLQFKGETAEKLSIHINKSKVEAATPPDFCARLIQDNVSISKQLLELNQDNSALKEMLHQTSEAKPSSTPFFSGALAGLVAGAALAAIIFNV